jgi:hypothetical protein
MSVNGRNHINTELQQQDWELPYGPTEFIGDHIYATASAENKGFVINSKKWNGHSKVSAFLTETHLYVVSRDSPLGEYVKIPYSSIESYSTSTAWTGYHKMTLTTEGYDYELYLQSDDPKDLIEDFVSSDPASSGQFERGYISELFLESTGADLIAQVNLETSGKGVDDIPSRNVRVLLFDSEMEVQKVSGDQSTTLPYSELVSAEPFEKNRKYARAAMETAASKLNDEITHWNVRASTYRRTGLLVGMCSGADLFFYKECREENRAKSKKSKAQISDEAVGAPSVQSVKKPSLPAEFAKELKTRIENHGGKAAHEYRLVRPSTSDAILRVEDWTDGASNLSADLAATSKTQGESRGVQVGAYTRSSVETTSSTSGEISGSISDNTYTTEIESFDILEERVAIESGLKLDLHYSDIQQFAEEGDGVVIVLNSITVRIAGCRQECLSEAVEFVNDRMAEFEAEADGAATAAQSVDSEQTDEPDPESRLKRLNSLHDQGLLSEEEFESKRSEIVSEL